jgi:exosortase
MTRVYTDDSALRAIDSKTVQRDLSQPSVGVYRTRKGQISQFCLIPGIIISDNLNTFDWDTDLERAKICGKCCSSDDRCSGAIRNPLNLSANDRTIRWLVGTGWFLACLALFWQPLRSLSALALHNEDTSHILLIPLISGWLFYLDQRKYVGKGSFDLIAAGIFLLPGVFLKLFADYGSSLNPSERLAANVLAFLFFLVAGYIGILGRTIARRTSFAICFLLFAVPLPDVLLNRLVYGLQAGSAEVAEVLFDLSGVPVLREGFIFRLPRMSIEVARECSGIRSSIALVILAVLISHFSFRPFWKKAVFVIAGLAMMLIKNGIRIATLTLLANYVDSDFLYGPLHHRGGVVFFLFGLGLLVPLYWWLRRAEPRTGKQASSPSPVG